MKCLVNLLIKFSILYSALRARASRWKFMTPSAYEPLLSSNAVFTRALVLHFSVNGYGGTIYSVRSVAGFSRFAPVLANLILELHGLCETVTCRIQE